MLLNYTILYSSIINKIFGSQFYQDKMIKQTLLLCLLKDNLTGLIITEFSIKKSKEKIHFLTCLTQTKALNLRTTITRKFNNKNQRRKQVS